MSKLVQTCWLYFLSSIKLLRSYGDVTALILFGHESENGPSKNIIVTVDLIENLQTVQQPARKLIRSVYHCEDVNELALFTG